MRREGKNVKFTYDELGSSDSCTILKIHKTGESDEKKSSAKIFNYHKKGEI